MSGQPLPPRLVEAFALNAPDCTPESPIAGGKTAPFPTGSQIAVLNGAASLNDGFVPLNMTAPTDGGVPPYGVDMNGILYLISAWAAYLAAGQLPLYDATLQTDMGGYAQGATLQQAADATATWTSNVAANMTDPDTTPASWISSKPLYDAVAPAAGTYNNVALPGASDFVIDYDTTAGGITITGWVAERDGQRVYANCVGANPLTFAAMTGSSAGNQLRIPTDVTAVLNQTYVFEYSTGADKWILV